MREGDEDKEVNTHLASRDALAAENVRLVVSSSYRVILPLSVIVGASFLVLADVVARTILSPAELPIGVVTAFIGAPFFALVLRTTRSSA